MIANVDWYEVTIELRRRGDLYRFSEMIGCGRNYISMLCRGIVNPSYEKGAKILNLYHGNDLLVSEINWPRLVLSLRSKGKLCKFSKSLGMAHNYLSNLCTDGGIPRYETGVKILELHKRVCGIEKHNYILGIKA